MNETKGYLPKVLVISSTPFSSTKNNGKTLSSFFEGYDRRRVAQFSFSGGDCNRDVCDDYFFLTINDVLSGKKGNAYHAEEIIQQNKRKAVQSNKSLIKTLFHFFSQARNPIAILMKNKIWKKADYSEVYKWIEQLNPDIVFFQGFSMAYGYEFTLKLCEKRNLPIILELTDDYTYRLYLYSIIERNNHKTYMSLFTKAIGIAYKTIAISDLMKREYEERFQGSIDVMMNTVKLNPDRLTLRNARNTNDYVYAGNLLLNRWKVLRNFGKALLKVYPDAVLNVYTPDVPPAHILHSLTSVRSIRYGGTLTKEELNQRLNLCGFVVHVEAFDIKNRKITRLSMSTKISEYIACGAKMIAIGPSDVASMKCLQDNHLGLCINSPSAKRIERALSEGEFYEDYETRAGAFLSRFASDLNGERIKRYITDAVMCHKSLQGR